MEIVAILPWSLCSRTNNLFWIAALILAFIQLPDLQTPLNSIAATLAGLTGRKEMEAVGDGASAPSETAVPNALSETSGKATSSPTGADAPPAEKV